MSGQCKECGEPTPNSPYTPAPVSCAHCGSVVDGLHSDKCPQREPQPKRRDGGVTSTPAPSLLDFDFAVLKGMGAGEELFLTQAFTDELNAQAAALVKAEREDGVWKRAYDDLHGQFQRETLRTSELSALVKRFIDEHHVRGGHPAIRWTKECVLCVILADAVALLAKPLNEEARDDHR